MLWRCLSHADGRLGFEGFFEEVNARIEAEFLAKRGVRLRKVIHSHILIHDKAEEKVYWVGSGIGSQSLRGDRKGNLTLNDCHAESLAVKSFRLFLWSCIDSPSPFFEATKSTVFSKKKRLFCVARGELKLRLRDEFCVVMYASRVPCGGASLKGSELMTKSHPLSLARAVKSGASWVEAARTVEQGRTRIKPVRKDTPAACISLTLSCTDKLYRCQYYGIQGNFLSNFYQSVYLSTLFVCDDEDNTAEIQKQFDRAVGAEGLFELNGKPFAAFSFHPLRISLSKAGPAAQPGKESHSGLAFAVHFCPERGGYATDFVSPKTGLREGATQKDFKNEKCASPLSSFSAQQRLKAQIPRSARLTSLAAKLAIDAESPASLKKLAIPYYCVSTRLKSLAA